MNSKAMLGGGLLFAAALGVVVIGLAIADEAGAPQGLVVGIGTAVLVASFFPCMQYGERFGAWLLAKVRRA